MYALVHREGQWYRGSATQRVTSLVGEAPGGGAAQQLAQILVGCGALAAARAAAGPPIQGALALLIREGSGAIGARRRGQRGAEVDLGVLTAASGGARDDGGRAGEAW